MIKGMASRQETAGLRRYTDAIAPYAIPVLRILVGITFFLTGLPKLTGLTGFTLFVASLGLPLPGFIAVIVAVMEVVGGLLLIVGLGTRWVSLCRATIRSARRLFCRWGVRTSLRYYGS